MTHELKKTIENHKKMWTYIKEQEEAYGYDNALGTNILMTLKKQVNKHDVAFLSNLFKCLGESDN